MTGASAGSQWSQHGRHGTLPPLIMRLVLRSGLPLDQEVVRNSVNIVKTDEHFLARVTWEVAPGARSTIEHLDFSEVAAVQMLELEQ